MGCSQHSEFGTFNPETKRKVVELGAFLVLRQTPNLVLGVTRITKTAGFISAHPSILTGPNSIFEVPSWNSDSKYRSHSCDPFGISDPVTHQLLDSLLRPSAAQRPWSKRVAVPNLDTFEAFRVNKGGATNLKLK